jgi:GNAT superfamily N-acetyltransferase
MFFRLSPETVYRRFFRPVREPSARVLEYLVSVDHDQREALVAEVDGEIVGVARYDRLRDRPNEAEVAIVVEDAWQHRGLGHRLMRRLADAAARAGVEAFTAEVLGGNRAAVDLVRSLAPTADVRFAYGEVVVRAPLPPAAA